MSTFDQWVVTKRNGETQEFERWRIFQALEKCLINGVNTDPVAAGEIAEYITKKVMNILGASGQTTINIETIQNLVIGQLWAENLEQAAEAYTFFRAEKRRQRTLLIPDALRQKIAHDRKIFTNDIQYYQLASKFARWREEDQRRETWTEVCERVIRWMKTLPKVKLYENEWQELYDALYSMDASCAMRVVQMAGPALEREPMGAFNCTAAYVNEVFSFPEALYILMQGCGFGFSVEEHHIQDLPKIRRQRRKPKEKIVVQDSTEGWCDAYSRYLQLLWDGYDADIDTSPVRPAGSRLKTKGGTASGPKPLLDLLAFAKKTILSREGLRLRDIDCHDLMCMTGRIVQVGGVRRAALISLSDLNSASMREAKAGRWWDENPQRSMANNSAVYMGQPSSGVFLTEWSSLERSRSGERGVFNRDAIRRALPRRRRAANRTSDLITNPCFHPDTRIATSGGLVRIADLSLDSPNWVVTDKRVTADSYQPGFGTRTVVASQVEKTQENAEVFEVFTNHGSSVKCTANHEFITARGRCQLKDLKIGDEVFLQSGSGEFGTWGTYGEGLLLGMVTGNGSLPLTDSIEDYAFVDLWEYDFPDMEMIKSEVNRVVATQASRNGRDYGCLEWGNQVSTVEKKRIGGKRLGRWIREVTACEHLHDIKEHVPECIWKGSRDAVSGYLAGLFYTDGTVCFAGAGKKQTISLRLSQTSKVFLNEVQMLLHNFGITSKVLYRGSAGFREMPDHKGGVREYYCQSHYELIINRPNCIRLLTQFQIPGRKGEKLRKVLRDRGTDCRKPERYIAKITAIVAAGRSDVYCLNQPETHAVIANGIVMGNCSEIILRHRQCCNLTMAIARQHDTAEDLRRKVRLATIFGTIQATCEDFHYVSPEWKINQEKERLLGVDITGQADCPLLQFKAPGRAKLLQGLRAEVARVNKDMAERFGIRRSAADTCVKPGGDSAVMYGCSSGISPRYSTYYMRWVREGASSPVAKFLIEEGVPWAPAPENPQELIVLGFPQKAPEGSTTRREMTAIDQCENWLMWKKNWAEHSVSTTVYIGDNEWLDTGAWVYRNINVVSGMAFLPRDNGTYTYAPHEELTEEQYTKAVAEFPVIHWERLTLHEKKDQTSITAAMACTGDRCEL